MLTSDFKLNLKTEYLKNEKNIIESIGDLVSFPSILDKHDSNTPFGKNIDDCLDKTLDIFKNLGFNVFKDQKGYYGYAEVGTGKEMVAILGHLDVVPSGDVSSWHTDPFKLEVRDGKLYGRGTQDDKGPVVTAMYAVKALMDLGVVFNRRVRFILGTDEENLWRCIYRYMEIEEKPTMGFTPDSQFPLIYAEKGLLQFVLEGAGSKNLELIGGDAYNAVPDKIEYTCKSTSELEKLEKELKNTYENFLIFGKKIVVRGKSAHASHCEKGINAIKKLIFAMKNSGVENDGIDFMYNEIGDDPFGEGVFGNLEDAPSGKLKFNLGKIEINPESTKLFIDIRIPVTVSKDRVVNLLKDSIKKYNLTYSERDFLDSLYVPIDHVLVKALREVYEEETDFDSTPISSGGATYARSMENCVAFGPVFPDSEKTEHQPNEYISLNDIQRAYIIYAKAIYKLTR